MEIHMNKYKQLIACNTRYQQHVAQEVNNVSYKKQISCLQDINLLQTRY